MYHETITLEDLKATIDSLIEIHGVKKEISDFCITIKNSNTVDYNMMSTIIKSSLKEGKKYDSEIN